MADIDPVPQDSNVPEGADYTSLRFGSSLALTADEVKARGGLIMPSYGHTPPYAVMPNGARYFAYQPPPNFFEEGVKKAMSVLGDMFGSPEPTPGLPPRAAGPPVPPQGAGPAEGADEGDEGDEGAQNDDQGGDDGEPPDQMPRPAGGGGTVGPAAAGAPRTAPIAPVAAPGPSPVQPLIDMLKAQILQPPPGFPAPRALSFGDHVVLGIIGALDPDAFSRDIVPMLQQDRNLPMAAAQWERQNHDHAVAMLQQLTNLQSQEISRESGEMHARNQEHQAAIAEASRVRHEYAMEGIAQERNRIMAAKSSAVKPLDSKTKQDFANMNDVIRMATAAKVYMLQHPHVGWAGAGLQEPFSAEAATFSAKLGDLKTTFMTAKDGKRITAVQMKLMGGAVPTMNKLPHQKMAALDEILDWAHGHVEALKQEWGMEGVPGEEQPGKIAAPPGFTAIPGWEMNDADLEEAH